MRGGGRLVAQDEVPRASKESRHPGVELARVGEPGNAGALVLLQAGGDPRGPGARTIAPERVLRRGIV